MTSAYDPRLIESQWSESWERDGCYRAPDHPDGPKFFNYDSGPFPNGSMHMGHVRTYLLGDVMARYQRAQGRSVLYCTEWDAFGLPNELQALSEGLSPGEFTDRCIRTMSRQMRTLGISYDWSRIRKTCDPQYYAWTQWLFLKLKELGLVSRRMARLLYCPQCETVLSRMQVEDERCWRCGTPVETRRLSQWFVSVSRYRQRLLAGLDRLERWSPAVRNLVRGFAHADRGRIAGDWLISRQRSWGTPIPVVFCKSCGAVPVPEDQLPVRLPDDLDWSLGSRALSSRSSFVETSCPRCRHSARRETDTLDCFFDDIWCFMACLVDLEDSPSFRSARLEAWMPIDQFHSGFDTIAYLHLHRFLAATLHDSGDLAIEEPILGHHGHEMVLARGRKMSKHLGNAVSPSAIIRRYGADALRVAVLWAAGPHTAIDWRPELLDRAVSLLDAVWRLYTRFVEWESNRTGGGRPAADRPTKTLQSLGHRAERSLATIGRFVEEHRPNAAIEEWASLFRRTESFAVRRLESARLSAADGRLLREILGAEIIMLCIFAPHLAEEIWHRLGKQTYVVQERWPVLARQDARVVGQSAGGA